MTMRFTARKGKTGKASGRAKKATKKPLKQKASKQGAESDADADVDADADADADAGAKEDDVFSKSLDEQIPSKFLLPSVFTIPDSCLVCDEPIIKSSVLFSCECVVVYCQQCAPYQIAAQRDTYLSGIFCPYCRVPSGNIRGIPECRTVETALVDSAVRHFNVRTSRNDDGVKKAMICMIAEGIRGSIPLEDINAEEEQIGPPVFRLELARMETLRLSKASGSKKKDDKKGEGDCHGMLPLGPLVHLSYTRNVILEHALDIQRQHRFLTEMVNGGALPSMPLSMNIGDGVAGMDSMDGIGSMAAFEQRLNADVGVHYDQLDEAIDSYDITSSSGRRSRAGRQPAMSSSSASTDVVPDSSEGSARFSPRQTRASKSLWESNRPGGHHEHDVHLSNENDSAAVNSNSKADNDDNDDDEEGDGEMAIPEAEGHVHFAVGEIVRISAGPFRGTLGTVLGTSKESKYLFLVEFMNGGGAMQVASFLGKNLEEYDEEAEFNAAVKLSQENVPLGPLEVGTGDEAAPVSSSTGLPRRTPEEHSNTEMETAADVAPSSSQPSSFSALLGGETAGGAGGLQTTNERTNRLDDSNDDIGGSETGETGETGSDGSGKPEGRTDAPAAVAKVSGSSHTGSSENSSDIERAQDSDEPLDSAAGPGPGPAEAVPQMRYCMEFFATMRYCVCQRPFIGHYIRCDHGVECNGWVHPKCCHELMKLTSDELLRLEADGYTCQACVRSRTNMPNLPSGIIQDRVRLPQLRFPQMSSTGALLKAVDPAANGANAVDAVQTNLLSAQRSSSHQNNVAVRASKGTGAAAASSARQEQSDRLLSVGSGNNLAVRVEENEEVNKAGTSDGGRGIRGSAAAKGRRGNAGAAQEVPSVIPAFPSPPTGSVSSSLSTSRSGSPITESNARTLPLPSPALPFNLTDESRQMREAVATSAMHHSGMAQNLLSWPNNLTEINSSVGGLELRLPQNLSVGESKVGDITNFASLASFGLPGVSADGLVNGRAEGAGLPSFLGASASAATSGAGGAAGEVSASGAAAAVPSGSSSENELDMRVIQWMISTSRTFPVLVNRPVINKEVPVRVVRSKFKQGVALEVETSSHSIQGMELLRRFRVLLQRIVRLDVATRGYLRKAHDLVKQHESLLEDSDIRRRNAMESTLQQLFGHAYSRYKFLGLGNPILTIAIRILMWCSRVFHALLNPETRPRQANIVTFIQNADELQRLARSVCANTSNFEISVSLTSPESSTGGRGSDRTKNDFDMQSRYQYAEELESVCFLLIEFWRKQLLRCLTRGAFPLQDQEADRLPATMPSGAPSVSGISAISPLKSADGRHQLASVSSANANPNPNHYSLLAGLADADGQIGSSLPARQPPLLASQNVSRLTPAGNQAQQRVHLLGAGLGRFPSAQPLGLRPGGPLSGLVRPHGRLGLVASEGPTGRLDRLSMERLERLEREALDRTHTSGPPHGLHVYPVGLSQASSTLDGRLDRSRVLNQSTNAAHLGPPRGLKAAGMSASIAASIGAGIGSGFRGIGAMRGRALGSSLGGIDGAFALGLRDPMRDPMRHSASSAGRDGHEREPMDARVDRRRTANAVIDMTTDDISGGSVGESGGASARAGKRSRMLTVDDTERLQSSSRAVIRKLQEVTQSINMSTMHVATDVAQALRAGGSDAGGTQTAPAANAQGGADKDTNQREAREVQASTPTSAEVAGVASNSSSSGSGSGSGSGSRVGGTTSQTINLTNGSTQNGSSNKERAASQTETLSAPAGNNIGKGGSGRGGGGRGRGGGGRGGGGRGGGNRVEQRTKEIAGMSAVRSK